MGICNSKVIDINLVQSVIFHVRQIHKKQIIMWDEKRARSWMLQRSWVFTEPPDTSKDNQIRMHIEKEDIFESLDFQDVGDGITIVFGIKAPPEPRRQYLNIGHSYKRRVPPLQDRKVHTIHDERKE